MGVEMFGRSDVFFGGSVQDAISQCRRKRTLLLVFLHGLDPESIGADIAIHQTLLSHSNCLGLRLYDDLANQHQSSYEDAKHFREIFPDIKVLPFAMILSPDGEPVAQLEGSQIADHIQDDLNRATANLPAQEAKAMSLNEADSSTLFRGSLDSNQSSTFRSNPPWRFSQGPATSSTGSSSGHTSQPSASRSSFAAGGMGPSSFGVHNPGLQLNLITSFPRTKATSLAETLAKASSEAAYAAAGHTWNEAQDRQTASIHSMTSIPESHFFPTSDAQTLPRANANPDAFSLPGHGIADPLHTASRGGAAREVDGSADSMPSNEPGVPKSEHSHCWPSTTDPAPANKSMQGHPVATPAAPASSGPEPHPNMPAASNRLDEGLGNWSDLRSPASQAHILDDAPANRSQEAPASQTNTEDQQGSTTQQEPTKQMPDKLDHDIRANSRQLAPPEAPAYQPSSPHQGSHEDTCQTGHSALSGESQKEGIGSTAEVLCDDQVSSKSADCVESYPDKRERVAGSEVADPHRGSALAMRKSSSTSSINKNAQRLHSQEASPPDDQEQSQPAAEDKHSFEPPEKQQQEDPVAHDCKPLISSQAQISAENQDHAAGGVYGSAAKPQVWYEDDQEPQAEAQPQLPSHQAQAPQTAAELLLALSQRKGKDASPTKGISVNHTQRPLQQTAYTGSQSPSYRTKASPFANQLIAESPHATPPSVSAEYQDSQQSSPPAANLRLKLSPPGAESDNCRLANETQVLSFRDLPETDTASSTYHSSATRAAFPPSMENGIAEIHHAKPASQQESPKAAAARKVFTPQGSTDVESKPPSKHRQRSPRRSNSLRRKSTQQAYAAYGQSRENLPASMNVQVRQPAPFRGFDTAHHRHASPMNSPRVDSQAEGRPKHDFFRPGEVEDPDSPAHFRGAFNVNPSQTEAMKEVTAHSTTSKPSLADVETPVQQQRLREANIIPLPPRDPGTTPQETPKEVAVGRAGMASVAVGHLPIYLGSLLLIVLGFISGLFSMGAKQMSAVQPAAIKEVLVQPFNLVAAPTKTEQKDSNTGTSHTQVSRGAQ